MKFEIPNSPESDLPNDLNTDHNKDHGDHRDKRQRDPTIPDGLSKGRGHKGKHGHKPSHDKSHRRHHEPRHGHKPIHDKHGMPVGHFDPLSHHYDNHSNNPDGLRNVHHGVSPESKIEDGLGRLNPFGKKKGKHGKGGLSNKMGRLMKPLNHKISDLGDSIDHTAKHAGSGLTGLKNHAKNGLRRGEMYGMMALRHLGRSVGHMFGGMLGNLGGAFGHAFGAVGGAVGLSAHAVGAVAVVGVASMSMIGATSFFTSHIMTDIGCSVQKVTDNSVSDKISGASGEWTQKGTKAYNLAKDIFAAAKKCGFNDNGAAGVVGNAEAEGAATGQLDEGEQDGSGDGGKGIFQFTPGSAGGGTLEAYEAWCKKNNHSPWQSALVEVQGLMAIKGTPPKNASSPSAGAHNWYFTCEDSVDNGTVGQRESNAEKAYSMFKGIGGESAGDNDTAASNSSGSSSCQGGNGSGDDDSSNSDIINYGEKYLGLPYTEDPRRNQGGEDIAAGKPKKDCDPTDCAGFVWGVMKHLNYKVTSGAPWTTPPEQHFSGCKHISASQTHAGIALVENDNGDPHTGFLKEKWRGKATKFLDEDGGSALGHDVGNNTYGTAFYGCYGTPVFLQEEKN